MKMNHMHVLRAVNLVLCLTCVVLGWMTFNPWPAIAGWAGFCLVVMWMMRSARIVQKHSGKTAAV